MKKVLIFFLLLFVSVINCYAKDHDFWDVYIADEEVRLYPGDKIILNLEDDLENHVNSYCEKYYKDTAEFNACKYDFQRVSRMWIWDPFSIGKEIEVVQNIITIEIPEKSYPYDNYRYYVVDRTHHAFYEWCERFLKIDFKSKTSYEPVVKISCNNDCDTNEYKCKFYVDHDLDKLKKEYSEEQIEEMLKSNFQTITLWDDFKWNYRMNQENYKDIFGDFSPIGYSFTLEKNYIELKDVKNASPTSSGKNWSNSTYITETSAWTDLATFTVDKDLIEDVLVIETEHSKIELPKNNEACDEEIKSEEKEEKDDFSEDSDVKGVFSNPKTGVRNLLITIIPLFLLLVIGLIVNNKDKIFKKI